MKYEFRLLIAVVLAYLLGCTSATTMRPSEIDRDEIAEGTYRFRLVNDQTFTTDRVTVEDSVFVVTAILNEGRRERVEPLVLQFADVASIEVVQLNVPVTLVVGIVVGSAITFWVLLLHSRSEWMN